jgi:oxygen-dependent protoporphyrinogen oxidase
VQRETAPLLQARGEARFAQAHAWNRAIPQYDLGHSKRMAAINERLRSLPGLSLIGNYLTGPSIGTCAEEAMKTARQIADPRK